MLRHVVLFRFAPESTRDQVDALADALRGLPAAIPEIRHYDVGPNAGENVDNWHFAVVADFDDAEGHRTYVADERHQEVIREFVHPIVTERAAVQYEV